MKGKYKALFGNTIIFAIGSLGARLITFLLVPLYTNVLTTDQYGTADLVITCGNMLVPIFSLVIQDSVLRFGLSNNNDKGTIIKNGFIVAIIGSIFAVAVTPLFGLYPAVSEWKWYLLAVCITNILSNILFSYTKAIEKNKLYSIAGIINAAILAGANVIFLVVLKLEVKGYLIANIISHILSVIFLLLFTGAIKESVKSKFDRKLLIEMIKYSAPLIVNNISWWVLNSSDRIMIDHYCSTSSLGLYTAASKIPALLSIVTTIFSQAWTVSAIKEYDEDRDKMFYSNIFKAFSLLMFMGCAAIVLITKPLMKLYVGKEFYSSWKYVPLLVVGAVYFAYSSFFGAMYGAVKKNFSIAMTTFVAAAVNIIINLMLLPVIGVFAAVLSTAISYFVIGIYRMLNSQKYYHFDINYKRFICNTLIVWSQAIIVMLDISVYIVSTVSVIALTLINWSDIQEAISIVCKYAKNRFGKI